MSASNSKPVTPNDLTSRTMRTEDMNNDKANEEFHGHR